MSIPSQAPADNGDTITRSAMIEFRARAIRGRIRPPAEDYDPDERPADEAEPADRLVCPDCKGTTEILVKAVYSDLADGDHNDFFALPCKTCGATGEVIF